MSDAASWNFSMVALIVSWSEGEANTVNRFSSVSTVICALGARFCKIVSKLAGGSFWNG